MTLTDLDTPVYLRRYRHFVDNKTGLVRQETKGPYDIATELPRRIQNVQSIEVTNYNLPFSIAPTFYPATRSAPGNNKIDVRLEPTGDPQSLLPPAPVLEYTVTLPTDEVYTEAAQLEEMLQRELQEQMEAQGDPYYNSANGVNWEVIFGNAEELDATDRLLGVIEFGVLVDDGGGVGPNRATVATTFLFGTGRNSANSAFRQLGFDQLDTRIFSSDDFPPIVPELQSAQGGVLSFAPVYGPQSYKAVLVPAFRFIDVFIEEVEPSLLPDTPIARLPIVGDSTHFVGNLVNGRARLLTQPLRHADKLQVRLRVEDGVIPSRISNTGWDLTLDILSLDSVQKVPKWLRQTLFL